MKEMKCNLYSSELAEPLFYFISNDERYTDFIECITVNGDMSIAEYVETFKLREFRAWLLTEYDIKLVERV